MRLVDVLVLGFDLHEVGAPQILHAEHAEDVIDHARAVLYVRMIDKAVWFEAREDKLVDKFFKRHSILQTDRYGDRETVEQATERSTLFVKVYKDFTKRAVAVLARTQEHRMTGDFSFLSPATTLCG